MIEILGSNEGREYEAALKLRDLLRECWNWLENDSHCDLKIISGVQCHGQSPRDLDLVLLCTFSNPVTFSPFLKFTDKKGINRQPPKVQIKDLCLVIEIKDHDLSGTRFTGTQLEVRYSKGWKNATQQNEKQKYSLKNYLEFNKLVAPFITNLIWLQNIRNSDLPVRPHNILGKNSSWDLFLNVIMQLVQPRYHNGNWEIGSSTPHKDVIKQTISILTKKIEPTILDRQKMDRICRSAVKVEWLSAIGNRQMIFHGRGGVGKTMILLRLAWQLYEEQQASVLLLTYNKALVADFSRLFTIMNLSDDIGQNTIQIQTVHSFFRQVLQGLGVLSEREDFLANYEETIKEALNYFQVGVFTSEDIESLGKVNEPFGWDYVFVDEAQDWFEAERDLLRQIYPARNLVIADGGDQLVRRNHSCNWQSGLRKEEREVFNLKKCLRMKAGLARFVNAFAQEIGIAWQAEPNIDAPGGKVIIIEGDYFKQPALHNEFIQENKAAGNFPVDMLVCVPPQLVTKDAESENAISIPAQTLTARGEKVWDGVNFDVRSSYPTSVNQLRIVQYDSCRGLEGWTVINLALDDFYEHKFNLWQPSLVKDNSLNDDPKQAHRFAARWVMIPLTRAIDSLVIQIDYKPSAIRTALEKAAALCPESVFWQKI